MASKLFDLKYLLEIGGGDEEFVADVLVAYLSATSKLIAVIEECSASGEAEKIAYAAHTLKGSSRSIGAEAFAALVESIEFSARRRDLDACRQMWPTLLQQHKDISLAIAQALQSSAA